MPKKNEIVVYQTDEFTVTRPIVRSDTPQPKVVVVIDLDLTLILHPEDLDINLSDCNSLYTYFKQLGLTFGTDVIFDPFAMLFVLHPVIAKNFFKFLFNKQHQDYIEIVILTNGQYNQEAIIELLARNYFISLQEFKYVKFYNRFSLGGAQVTKANKIYQIVSEDDHVVLIDDLVINCTQAMQLGYWVVQANLGDPGFFHQAQILIRELLLGLKYELETIAALEAAHDTKAKKSPRCLFW